MKNLVVVEPHVFRTVYPGGEVRSIDLRGHVLPPHVSLEVGQNEMEGVGQRGHVRETDIPVHTLDKTSGVVHKEQDLPVTHILGSKGKDRDEYRQNLEIFLGTRFSKV